MRVRLILFFLLCNSLFILAQSSSQIKAAKKFVKDSGITENEARALAKSKGYSDQEIDAAIQKQ